MVDTVVRKPEPIYDSESDILRMQFEDKPSVRSVEVAESVWSWTTTRKAASWR